MSGPGLFLFIIEKFVTENAKEKMSGIIVCLAAISRMAVEDIFQSERMQIWKENI